MNNYNKQVFVATISLLVLDLLWLSFYMADKYEVMVKQIQGSTMNVNFKSAIGAYLLMIVVLINIIIKYNLSYFDTFILGFCLYGVYDLTCGAIFNKWNFQLAFADMLWGGIVYTTALYISKELV